MTRSVRADVSFHRPIWLLTVLTAWNDRYQEGFDRPGSIEVGHCVARSLRELRVPMDAMLIVVGWDFMRLLTGVLLLFQHDRLMATEERLQLRLDETIPMTTPESRWGAIVLVYGWMCFRWYSACFWSLAASLDLCR